MVHDMHKCGVMYHIIYSFLVQSRIQPEDGHKSRNM